VTRPHARRPERSLVRDERTHPHRPRLVVYHSTCRPLSSSPPREQLCNRSCSNKHTHLSAYKDEPLSSAHLPKTRQPTGALHPTKPPDAAAFSFSNNNSNDVDPLLLFSEASLTVLFQARRVPGTKHSSHVQCVPIRARNCSPGLRLSGTTTRKSAWRFTLSSRLGREMRGDELPVVVTVCIFLAAGRYASRLDYGRLVTCVGVFCGRCVHEPYADWCGVG
jgi:hypothetical protein